MRSSLVPTQHSVDIFHSQTMCVASLSVSLSPCFGTHIFQPFQISVLPCPLSRHVHMSNVYLFLFLSPPCRFLHSALELCSFSQTEKFTYSESSKLWQSYDLFSGCLVFKASKRTQSISNFLFLVLILVVPCPTPDPESFFFLSIFLCFS